MSKTVKYSLVLLLAAYSLTLATVELCTDQDYVRNFFTDITGPVKLYAANTSLSVFFLWGTALLFAVCFAHASREGAPRSHCWFYLSQCVVFGYLGCDDRFQIHETIGYWLDVGDHYWLGAVAVGEVLLLAILGRQGVPTRRAWWLLGIASLLFCLMTVFDALVPHDMVLRLSIEDLAKLWSCLFFLLFAWETLLARITPTRGEPTGPKPLPEAASTG